MRIVEPIHKARAVPVLFRTLILVFLGMVPAAVSATDELSASILPVLARHCIGCHSGAAAKGGLNLATDASAALAPAMSDIARLDIIADRLGSHTMPPPESDAPLGDADRGLLLSWIESQIDRRLAGQANPGSVTIRRLTRIDYRNTIRDLLDCVVDVSGFPSDDVAHGFDNLADMISLPPLLMERYSDAAERVAQQWCIRTLGEGHALHPSPEQTPQQRALKILIPLVSRAFRRPITPLEEQSVRSFFDQCMQDSFRFDEAMQASVTRVLISPQFLYRIEKDGPIGQDSALNDFELASRLSYFLWSSMPDEALFHLAEQGQLQRGDNLQQQVKRMLRDPKLRHGLVENFVGQWLQTKRLRAIRPDPKAFPEFDEPLRIAMEEETFRLFEAILHDELPFTDLLDADYTFVNQRLARHYGIAGIEGDAFQRVSLAGLPRRGVLTHAGILAINSHPLQTSPVLRGKWIMAAILGTPPPPPPAGVPDLAMVDASATLRQRMEMHRSHTNCASCHARMDALGVSLENFDAIGAWRTTDGSLSIDPTGTLPDGGTFKNAIELTSLLREKYSGALRNTLAHSMTVYALGRTLGMYDRLPLRRIIARVTHDNDRLSTLIIAIVESDFFGQRHNAGRIAAENCPEPFHVDISGNPDQQSILTVRANAQANHPLEQEVSFELHTLKPLLHASTRSGRAVGVGKAVGGTEAKQVFRYSITVPVDEPVSLSFLQGIIGQQEYSDDFLKGIAFVPPSDEDRILDIAQSSHGWNGSWNGSLIGPSNIRPGTLLAFDFDVELVAKQSASCEVFLATPGGVNSSMISNSGPFRIQGEGKHRLTQVGIRNATTHDAWNSNITLVIHSRTQTVISNVSPIHAIRPQLGVSDTSPIRFEPVAINMAAVSAERCVRNAQKATLTDQKNSVWRSVLYGMCRVASDPKRVYLTTTEHVGAEFIGEHAAHFTFVGKNATDTGNGLALIGEDGKPGLEGGSEPETEAFQVAFRGAATVGTYRATLRVVTQAGNTGVPSSGNRGEPQAGFYSVNIPVEAIVQ